MMQSIALTDSVADADDCFVIINNNNNNNSSSISDYDAADEDYDLCEDFCNLTLARSVIKPAFFDPPRDVISVLSDEMTSSNVLLLTSPPAISLSATITDSIEYPTPILGIVEENILESDTENDGPDFSQVINAANKQASLQQQQQPPDELTESVYSNCLEEKIEQAELGACTTKRGKKLKRQRLRGKKRSKRRVLTHKPRLARNHKVANIAMSM